MGCPDRSVEKQGGGAAMMKNQALAIMVLKAAREGVKMACKYSSESPIPVSVKTRIGYSKIDFDWLQLLLSETSPTLPALTVHLRTRKEMSDLPAHWEIMQKIVKLRDHVQSDLAPNKRTLLIGNGDITSLDDARKKIQETGCDGVMIGRGIFGKPWIFSGDKEYKPEIRLKMMLEHATIFEKMFGGKSKRLKNFAVMKKHFKAYVSGWDGAKELRVKLMKSENLNDVKTIVNNYL